MALFRILHASDLHFSRRAHQIGLPEVRHAWAHQIQGPIAPVASQSDICADAFAAFAQANAPGVDVILISGDLATTGSPGDLSAAHRYLFSPVAQGYLSARHRPTLQAAGRDIALLPGNHDRFRNLHLPGGKQFDRAFATHWPAKQGAHQLWSKTRSGATLTVFAADFTLRTMDLGGKWCGIPSFGFLGRGRVYHRPLNALVALTQAARRRIPAIAVLWVAHFEPDNRDPSLRLLAERRLDHALQEVKVDGILCGHSHAPNPHPKFFAGVEVFVCGTTTQHAAHAGNHLQVIEVRIAGQGGVNVTRTSFTYDPARGGFFN